MIFETHAHYDDEVFNEDRGQLLAGLPEKGIGRVINVGASIETTKTTLALAEAYDYIYAAVGVHPSDIDGLNEETYSWLKEQTAHPKTVAVGEIGLDYYWEKEERARARQQVVFARQMELARELKLPVIVHDRDAHADCMEITRRYPDVIGVYHCYAGHIEMARELLERGYYLSFTGVITFKNAKKAIEVIREVPIERLMVETDSPYMAPEPFRGRRNSSLYVYRMAEKIAEIKGMPVEDVERITTENGRRLFGIV